MFKRKASKHSKHESKKHKKKKSLLYKISFATILFASLILAYFVILVSAEPKSFPYLTKEIEKYIEENFTNDVEIENSTITFTPYGTFKINIINLKINKKYVNVDGENKEFVIPRMEMEFSIFRLILFDLTPYKIKIYDSEILVGNFYNLQVQISDSMPASNSPLCDLFTAIKDGKLKIKIVAIENAKLVLMQDDKIKKQILVRKSEIKIKSSLISAKNKLRISSTNIINIDKATSDIYFNANCELADRELTNCDVAAANIETSAIANFNPALKNLEKIKASLNFTANILINDKNIQSVNFKALAKNGSADLPEFFSEKIIFSNLIASGNYNKSLDSLNLSEVKADIGIIHNQNQEIENTKITMSVLLTDMTNLQNNKSDFYIRLENVGKGGLKKFWPIFLPGQDIRQWVINHIYEERIKDAYTKFTLKKTDGVSNLDKLDAKVVFENLNINYDDYFPKISSAKGVALFSKQGMRILINDADVLESKISNAEVSIADFMADHIFLEIKGKISGKAADGLKHANYNSAFGNELEKYLNGKSVGEFDIKLPLHQEITLHSIYLAANLNVQNLKNDFVTGDVKISTKKNFNNNNFTSSIDLTGANLIAKAFDIEKKSGEKSSLNFVLNVKNNNLLQFKNLILEKEEKNQTNNTISKALISGNFDLVIDPLKITALNIKNQNFGKNNYIFSYANLKNQEIISLKGSHFNLASFLENKIMPSQISKNSTKNSDSLYVENLSAKVVVGKVFMVKNKQINKFSLVINRKNKFYQSFLIKGSQANKPLIMISTTDFSKKYPLISGNLYDIGYLAEALNISDAISKGRAKVNVEQSLENNNLLLKGKLETEDDITFYENNTVKKLEKDNLFVKVKDKIFSNNKTTFSSLKLNFNVIDNKIEIESLLANNYKIGITAKGLIDLKNNTVNIKGMIIPGFVINNLFGIGKIPLIGGVISGLLTGGEGGGLFGIKYEYSKAANQEEGVFKTDVVSAFVPVSIRNLFEF